MIFSMRRPFSLALLAVVIAVSSQAVAQDDPRKVQAAPYFEEARKLAEKGDNAESLEKFKKAHSIYPSPNTLFNIARQEQLLGQRVAALRDYREALKNPILLPQNAEMARGHVAELERSLGRLNVVGPASTRITVAGTEYTLPLAAPIDVEPGSVAIRGLQGSTELSATANATAGQLVTVDLGAKDSSAIEPPPTTPRDEGSVVGLRSIAGLVLVGAGAIALGVGVAASSEKSSQQDRMNELAGSLPPGDPGTRCFNSTSQVCNDYRTARQERDDAESRADVWIPVGIGALIVGGGLVASAFIWKHGGSTSAAQNIRVVPISGPREAGLLLQTAF